MATKSGYEIRALGPKTWRDYAALIERHNGVWGGCWCTWFHTMSWEKERNSAANRALKEKLVRADRAHAALVYDGDRAVGWCQFGPPAELPNIYHRKQVETEGYRPPDYRITCLFVDRDYRRRGVARAAAKGALDLIAARGGGVVETYPMDNQGEKVSASFIYNGTRSMWEGLGFRHILDKGKNSTVMRKTVRRAKSGS